MNEGMVNLMTQLANMRPHNSNISECLHKAQPASFISERRNKKRKELVQSIFDASPFTMQG